MKSTNKLTHRSRSLMAAALLTAFLASGSAHAVTNEELAKKLEEPY